MRWLAPALLLAFAAALAWLASASLAAQLEAEARRQTSLYASGDSPYRWDFAKPGAIVGPPLGLHVEAATGAGLELRLINGHGNLGLRLSGRRVDPGSLPRLQLSYRAEQPLELRVAVAPDLRPTLDAGASVELQPGQHLLKLDLADLLPDSSHAPLAQLRLWIRGEPGQLIELQRLQLLPAHCPEPPCLPPRIELESIALGGAALARRDAILEGSPQALVGTAATEALVGASLFLQARSTPQMAGLGLLLLAAGAALLALHDGRLRSACALMLGAAVPMGLLAVGLPRFPDQTGDALLFCGLALALWIARPQNSSTSSGPPAAAWRQTLLFTACALLPLLAIAGLSDAPARWPDADRLLRYSAFAALQQLWLARFLLPHLRRIGLRRMATPTAALLFAGLHLPNAELMALTCLAGLAWATLAQRHGRIWPQIASHIALGIAAIALLPPELLRSAEVGARFLLAPS